MIRALAITISNRAAAGVYADRSGPVLVRLLRAQGCEVDGPQVIADGDPVETALRDAVKAGYDVVITTGGTGLTPTDRTPEMTKKVIDREIPVPPEVRMRSTFSLTAATSARPTAGPSVTTAAAGTSKPR